MPKNLLSKTRIVPLIVALFLISYAAVNYNWGKPTKGDNFFFGAKNNQSKPELVTSTYEITNPEITGLPGRWAIAVKNLKTDETYLLRADQKFPSASIYKLAVLYKAYDSIKKGELAKDDLVSGEISATEKASPNSASPSGEPEKKYVSFTVVDALNLMITISDNSSAILLSEHLGWGSIDEFMEAQNLGGIDLVEKDATTATAGSILALLERIYRHTAVDWQSSEEMQKLLFAQKNNDRIPKYLPEGTRVGHKTGELGPVRHDAGIIEGRKNHYIFVFLTETSNSTEASETIARLSKKIYDALEGNRP